MAVADDALTEIFDVAVLLSHQGAPGGFHPRLVPAVDRPLRRLAAVVVLQRLTLQTIARIARKISGGLFAWHVISPSSLDRHDDREQDKPRLVRHRHRGLFLRLRAAIGILQSSIP